MKTSKIKVNSRGYGMEYALDEVEVELFPEIEIQELELDLQEIEVEVLEFELI